MTVQDKKDTSTPLKQGRYLVYLGIRSEPTASLKPLSNLIRIMHWGSFQPAIMLCQGHFVPFRGSLKPCAPAYKTVQQADLRDSHVIIYQIKNPGFSPSSKRMSNGPFLTHESQHPTLTWPTYVQQQRQGARVAFLPSDGDCANTLSRTPYIQSRLP